MNKVKKRKYDLIKYNTLVNFVKNNTALMWRKNKISIIELFINAIQVYELWFFIKFLEIYWYKKWFNYFFKVREYFTHPELKERWDRNFNFFMFLNEIKNIKDKETIKKLYLKYKDFLPYEEDLEWFKEYFSFL